jgi:hypothetical protein
MDYREFIFMVLALLCHFSLDGNQFARAREAAKIIEKKREKIFKNCQRARVRILCFDGMKLLCCCFGASAGK